MKDNVCCRHASLFFIIFLMCVVFPSTLPAKPHVNSDDVFKMSLKELMTIQVEVASLFLEDELVVGSTVSRIDPTDWNNLSAKRLFDALTNEPGIIMLPHGGQA